MASMRIALIFPKYYTHYNLVKQMLSHIGEFRISKFRRAKLALEHMCRYCMCTLGTLPEADPWTVHDDVIKWKHFPRYWPFLRRIPVNSPHKGQWRGALMFSLICVWINDWVNSGEAGDVWRYRIHYDVTVMLCVCPILRRPYCE